MIKSLTTYMSLKHIHVLTCVDVPFSLDHVTTKQMLPQFISALVNLETTTLSLHMAKLFVNIY